MTKDTAEKHLNLQELKEKLRESAEGFAEEKMYYMAASRTQQIKGVELAESCIEDQLQALRQEVEKQQEYYYHNTDEDTSEIVYKVYEDVLNLIDKHL